MLGILLGKGGGDAEGNSGTVPVQIFKYQEVHCKLKLNLKLSPTIYYWVNQAIIYWVIWAYSRPQSKIDPGYTGL